VKRENSRRDQKDAVAGKRRCAEARDPASAGNEEVLAAPSPGRSAARAASVAVLAAPSTGRRPSAHRRKSAGGAQRPCQGEVLSGPIPRPKKRDPVGPQPDGKRIGTKAECPSRSEPSTNQQGGKWCAGDQNGRLTNQR